MTHVNHPSLRQIAELRGAAVSAVRDHYRQQGLLEVRVPTIVGVTGSCENVATLFGVISSAELLESKTHEERETRELLRGYLTQTGQLSLERLITETRGCWCHTGSYRFDNRDTRHLQEFELIEEEFAWNHPSLASIPASYSPAILFESLLSRITALIQAITKAIDRKLIVEIAGTYDHIEAISEGEFTCFSYDEALEIANSVRIGLGKRRLWEGDDLDGEDEAALIRYSSSRSTTRPLFITHFPEEMKFFNMKVDPLDEARVLSADLILPWAGEAVGAAVREDNYPVLLRRLEASSMLAILRAQGAGSQDEFEPYLELMRNESIPGHAGYGMGLERVLQFLTISSNIRDVSSPARLTDASVGNAGRFPTESAED